MAWSNLCSWKEVSTVLLKHFSAPLLEPTATLVSLDDCMAFDKAVCCSGIKRFVRVAGKHEWAPSPDGAKAPAYVLVEEDDPGTRMKMDIQLRHASRRSPDGGCSVYSAKGSKTQLMAVEGKGIK